MGREAVQAQMAAATSRQATAPARTHADGFTRRRYASRSSAEFIFLSADSLNICLPSDPCLSDDVATCVTPLFGARRARDAYVPDFSSRTNSTRSTFST